MTTTGDPRNPTQQQRAERGWMKVACYKLPEDLQQQITTAAKAQGITKGEYVRRVLQAAAEDRP